jgi:CRP-like cAMP-binding protein
MSSGSSKLTNLRPRRPLTRTRLPIPCSSPASCASFSDVLVQAEGTALQKEAGAFRRTLDEAPDFKRLLLRYGAAMHAQTTQRAACNGVHDLEQRLARWLLMAHDRAEGDELPMTQELLALMLCVSRPSITVVANAPRRAGFIRYSRGSIEWHWKLSPATATAR